MPDLFGNETDAEYEARRLRERKFSTGTDPNANTKIRAETVVGKNDPLAAPGAWAAERMREAGVDAGVRNYGMYQDILGRYGATPVTNPYTSTAGANRTAQGALLDSMRAGLGSSAVALAGGAAQDKALAAALRRPVDRNTASRVAAGLGAMAADTGRSRMQEYMAAQATLGRGGAAMRGADQQTMQDQFNAALDARGLSNRRAAFAAGTGSELERARQQALANKFRMYAALKQQAQQNNMNTANQVAGTGQAVAGTVSQFMPKKGA